MSRKRERLKNRKSGKRFFMLHNDLVSSPNWFKLYDRSQRLFIDLLSQYNGKNNGDLCATWSFMKERGWTSAEKLSKALKELKYYGFIKVSRQGGRNSPTLLALTCFPIDECDSKHDLNTTSVATNDFKATKKDWVPISRDQKAYSTSGAEVIHIGSSQR